MDSRTEALLERLEGWCEAYPPDIFPPPKGSYKTKDGDYSTEEKRGIITKASAAMGRHMIERALRPACAEIRRLATQIERQE